MHADGDVSGYRWGNARKRALLDREALEAEREFARARADMIASIERFMAITSVRTGRAKLSKAVAAALARTPRHQFMPPELRAEAYENVPHGIGQGQTISQPFIVALMVDLLDIKPDDTVLEIGTGSGYQTAILATLAATVYTVEIIDSLHAEVAKRLARLGYKNVVTRLGNGRRGWPGKGPFDAIVVSAAAEKIPQRLVRQLSPGGKMVLVVRRRADEEKLVVVQKTADGKLTTRDLIPVSFVPLTGKP